MMVGWSLGGLSIEGPWLPMSQNIGRLSPAHLRVAVPFFQVPSKPQIMSLWGLVSQMPPEKLQRLYVDFPHHLRHLLGEWLENQPW